MKHRQIVTGVVGILAMTALGFGIGGHENRDALSSDQTSTAARLARESSPLRAGPIAIAMPDLGPSLATEAVPSTTGNGTVAPGTPEAGWDAMETAQVALGIRRSDSCNVERILQLTDAVHIGQTTYQAVIRTDSVSVISASGDVLQFDRPAGAPTVRTDGVVERTAADGVLEVYEARPEGLEQSFVIPSAPRGGADFTVEARLVSSAPLDEESSAQSLQFGNGSITYARAVAVDRNGAEQPIPIRYDATSQDLRLSVPGGWLSAPERRFPVVLDPLIGPPARIADSAETFFQRPAIGFMDAPYSEDSRFYVLHARASDYILPLSILNQDGGVVENGGLILEAGSTVTAPSVVCDPQTGIVWFAMEERRTGLPTRCLVAGWDSAVRRMILFDDFSYRNLPLDRFAAVGCRDAAGNSAPRLAETGTPGTALLTWTERRSGVCRAMAQTLSVDESGIARKGPILALGATREAHPLTPARIATDGSHIAVATLAQDGGSLLVHILATQPALAYSHTLVLEHSVPVNISYDIAWREQFVCVYAGWTTTTSGSWQVTPFLRGFLAAIDGTADISGRSLSKPLDLTGILAKPGSTSSRLRGRGCTLMYTRFTDELVLVDHWSDFLQERIASHVFRTGLTLPSTPTDSATCSAHISSFQPSTLLASGQIFLGLDAALGANNRCLLAYSSRPHAAYFTPAFLSGASLGGVTRAQAFEIGDSRIEQATAPADPRVFVLGSPSTPLRCDAFVHLENDRVMKVTTRLADADGAWHPIDLAYQDTHSHLETEIYPANTNPSGTDTRHSELVPSGDASSYDWGKWSNLPGTYVVRMRTILENGSSSAWVQGGTFRAVRFSGVRGDYDNNGTVDRADLISLYYRIARDLWGSFANRAQPTPYLECADADFSGRIDRADFSFLYNFLYRGGAAPAPAAGSPTPLYK